MLFVPYLLTWIIQLKSTLPQYNKVRLRDSRRINMPRFTNTTKKEQ